MVVGLYYSVVYIMIEIYHITFNHGLYVNGWYRLINFSVVTLLHTIISMQSSMYLLYLFFIGTSTKINC